MTLSKRARARRKKAEQEWGDIRSLGIAVFRDPNARKRFKFRSSESIEQAAKEAKAAFPGSKIVYGKAKKGQRWRATVVFPYPISREVLAKRIKKIKLSDPTGGRVHLLAGHRKPKTLMEPLSVAHRHARAALAEAQDQLLTDYFQYHVGDSDDDDMEPEQIARSVARIDRRKRRPKKRTPKKPNKRSPKKPKKPKKRRKK